MKSVVRSRASVAWPGNFNDSKGFYPQRAKHWSDFRANHIERRPRGLTTWRPTSHVPYLPHRATRPTPQIFRCLGRRASDRLQP